MAAADTKTMARTILLADDSPTIQRVVELTFAGEDVRVVSVGDGRSAIEAVRQSPPDLVLADIGMPEPTGYDVLEFVRSQPALSDLPVMLLAGAFEEIDHGRVARMGGDGVLSKPFDPSALVSRVSQLLAQGRAPALAPSARPSPSPSPSPLPSAPASAAPERPASERDRYFEEIDQAFAALARTPRPSLVPAAEPGPQADRRERDAVEPGAGGEAAAAPAPLAGAFAALLESERTGVPPAALRRPAPLAPSPEPVDIERLADLVARRVLEQLSDRVVADTVAEIVSATAERLVREEIERIKRHIK